MKKFICSLMGMFLVLGFSFAKEVYQSHEKRHSFEKRVEISIDYWTIIPNGWFSFNGKKYDLREDFKLKNAKDFGGKIIYDGIEWGFMNIIFTYTPIKFEGKGKASTAFSIKSFNVNAGERYETIYNFKNYDLGFLWDVGHLKKKTEDRLDIRAGISARYLDGSLELKSDNGSEYKEDYNKIIPMLDVEAEVEVLPVHQNLTAEIILEYQGYAYNEEYMHDFIDALRINYIRGFIEGGYRIVKYKLKKNNIKTKTSGEGFFISLGIMF